jgi:predicted NAD/FAD-binding protein
MSFGYHDERSGLMYGSRDLSMLLARRSNLLSPSFYRMVRGILRFWKELPSALKDGTLGNQSLKDFCGSKYSSDFYVHYLEPFAGAIWSASGKSVLDMPAELCARFFTNHGMLSYADNPQWQTVVGGSHSYLHAFEKGFKGTIFRGRKVIRLIRDATGVELSFEGHDPVRYDAVVIATHADQALKLLGDPTPDENRLLGQWTYSNNRTVLHTDISFLPPLDRAIASWNYRRSLHEDGLSPVSVTYHMNTLMGLKTKKNYCVTLNPRKEVPSSEIVKEFNYTHPEFTSASFATQPELPSLNGVQKTWFCGSYFRWGFHEDAVMSAVSVAKDFGIDL